MNLWIFRFDQNRLRKWFPTLCSAFYYQWNVICDTSLAPSANRILIFSAIVVTRFAPPWVILKWPNSFLVAFEIFFWELPLRMNLIHIQSSEIDINFSCIRVFMHPSFYAWLLKQRPGLTQWSLLSEQETLDSRFLCNFVWQKCFKSFRFLFSFSIVFRIK